MRWMSAAASSTRSAPRVGVHSLALIGLVIYRVFVSEVAMKAWPVQDAKARFSELLVACERDGPQVVTKRGVEAAVLVPYAEWRRLTGDLRPDLKDLLLSDEARCDDLVPRRSGLRPRAPIEL